MNEVIIGTIVSVAVAALSGGGAWYAARALNKKAPAEIITALSESAVNLVDPLNDAIRGLRLELDQLRDEFDNQDRQCQEKILRLEAENNILLRWSNVLIEQIIKAGGVPVSIEELRRYDNNDV